MRWWHRNDNSWACCCKWQKACPHPIYAQSLFRSISYKSISVSIVHTSAPGLPIYLLLAYPPVIKRGKWKSTVNVGFNRKNNYFYSAFSSTPCLMTGGYTIPPISSISPNYRLEDNVGYVAIDGISSIINDPEEFLSPPASPADLSARHRSGHGEFSWPRPPPRTWRASSPRAEHVGGSGGKVKV